jgi:hypothetical protein
MRPDGSYVRAPRSGSGFAAQSWLMEHAHHAEQETLPPAI